MSYPFNFGFLYGAENDGNQPPLAVPSTFTKTSTPTTAYNTQLFNTVGNVSNNVANSSLVSTVTNNYASATLNDIVSYYKNNPVKKVDLVDVVNDFMWTISPKTSRKDVPYIWINERYITLNAVLNQALYGVSAILDNKVSQTTIKSLRQASKSFESSLSPLSSIGVYNSVQQFFSGLGDDLTTVSSKIQDKFGVVDTLAATLEAPLAPYKGLYYTVESGFNYKLPLFNSDFWQTTNNFDNSTSDTNSEFITGLASSLQGLGIEASKIINTGSNQYGTYVEFPKQYAMASPNSYEVTFDLINTKPGNYVDVKSNFKFLLLLFYQNLPIRRSKQLVDPPVIYNIYVPGQKRMPYAFLSKFAVKNLGATRVMDIDLTDIKTVNPPNSGQNLLPSSIKTVVPDGYRVTLTFNDLIPETKNTVYASFLGNSLIETSIR